MAMIKIYVSEEEKERLKECAELSGMSLSAYAVSKIKPSTKDFCAPISEVQENRTKVIYVRASESEYEQIKKNANGKSLSSFGRISMLSSGKPITITIATDDIISLESLMSEKLTHFQNAIEALAFRSVLNPAESEKLLGLLTEMRDDLKQMTRQTKTNRKSIKNAGLRWLKETYRNQAKEAL